MIQLDAGGMSPVNRALLMFGIYVIYVAAVGKLLTAAMRSALETQTRIAEPGSRVAQRPTDEVGRSRVVVAISGGNGADAFTIRCLTTRDRISTDVLFLANTDDVVEIVHELECKPEWQP